MPYKIKFRGSFVGTKKYKIYKKDFRTKQDACNEINRMRKTIRQLNKSPASRKHKHLTLNARIVEVKK